jgi:ribosome biogenesis GTPase A
MACSSWQQMDNASKEIGKLNMSEIETFFKDELNKWKDVEINIAITGTPGVGKSSFINAIRG